MSELKPVSRPPFLLDGRGSKVLAVVVVALLIALIKPWGALPEQRFAAIPPSATPAPSPSPRPVPSEDLGDGVTRPYDPLIFGDKELQPAWALWPAGYLVSFGFAMRAEPSPEAPPSSTAPQGSAKAGASSQPSASPSASAAVARDAAPAWPDSIDILPGNHLLLIGVSTPLGYSVDTVRLMRIADDGAGEEVPTMRPTSPWPTHLTVIAVDGGRGPDRPAFWLPGTYRLDLVIQPGPILRTITVRVEGLPGASPRPSDSATP